MARALQFNFEHGDILRRKNTEAHMLRYSLVFLLIALLAGVFGFTTVAGTAYVFAKVLFFVFLVLFVLSLVMGRSVVREV